MREYTAVRQWPLLDYVYPTLYDAIGRHRTTISDSLAILTEATYEFDYERITSYVNDALNIIEGNFRVVDDLLATMQRDDVPEAVRDILAISAYRMTYTQADYWHVLIDGIIFEGALEEIGREFLEEVSEVTHIAVLELLESAIDPETRAYTSGKASGAESEEGPSVEDVCHLLRERGDPQIEEKFRRFVELYSRVKRWQVEFGEGTRSGFEKYIPDLRERVAAIAKGIGTTLGPEELKPFRLLDVIEEVVLPKYLASHSNTEGAENRNG